MTSSCCRRSCRECCRSGDRWRSPREQSLTPLLTLHARPKCCHQGKFVPMHPVFMCAAQNQDGFTS